MRFKEKLILTLRGYRMLHQLVPGAMLWAFVQNLVRALTPFLNVYLSGRIIDFLAQGRPLRDLLWLVGITVTVNALLKLTEQASGRTVDYLIEKLDAVWEKPLYEKIQTMDYARVEDVRSAKLKSCAAPADSALCACIFLFSTVFAVFSWFFFL